MKNFIEDLTVQITPYLSSRPQESALLKIRMVVTVYGVPSTYTTYLRGDFLQDRMSQVFDTAQAEIRRQLLKQTRCKGQHGRAGG